MAGRIGREEWAGGLGGKRCLAWVGRTPVFLSSKDPLWEGLEKLQKTFLRIDGRVKLGKYSEL